MTDEPKFRYADGSGRDPGPMLDGPKNMTINQALKYHHAPWLYRPWLITMIALLKVYGRLTRPLRRRRQERS